MQCKADHRFRSRVPAEVDEHVDHASHVVVAQAARLGAATVSRQAAHAAPLVTSALLEARGVSK